MVQYQITMILITLYVALGVIQATPMPNLVNEKWAFFKNKYEKHYENEIEESFRFQIFIDNLNKIDAHNEKYKKGIVTYTLGMNKFGDLLEHEIIKKISCLKKTSSTKHANKTYIPPLNRELDSQVDWRAKGAVTEVKNQASCGSCWAFSATGSIEGQNYLKHGKLISLSEQNLVDCDVLDNGCKGGFMTQAFTYIRSNGGIDSENSYPYEGFKDKCRFKVDNVSARVIGFNTIKQGSEDDLKSAVATIGPISVGVNAQFAFYKGGVYDDPTCDPNTLNHAVLVVGYGITEKKQEYWIVKNSWGNYWGEKGYILMSRNKNNQCGIANSASYPLV